MESIISLRFSKQAAMSMRGIVKKGPMTMSGRDQMTGSGRMLARKSLSRSLTSKIKIRKSLKRLSKRRRNLIVINQKKKRSNQATLYFQT
tara:strand:+ start:251 stop:520 length:270 start_codon:yes stop_codon:yes gene_type:complete